MGTKIAIRQVEGTSVLEVSGRTTLGEGGAAFRDAIQDEIQKQVARLR